MAGYQQHCPIARTLERLGEPWTLLVVRELLTGSRSAAELVRGLPGASRSTLESRLRDLQAMDVVCRVPGDHGHRYQLTAAGRELRPILERLGHWGQRWLGPPGPGEFDARGLLHDIARQAVPGRLPPHRTVLRADLTHPDGTAWLVLSAGGAIATDTDPGGTADVVMTCTTAVLAAVWLGHTTWLDALQSHTLRVTGSPELVRAVPTWLGRSGFAGTSRIARTGWRPKPATSTAR